MHLVKEYEFVFLRIVEPLENKKDAKKTATSAGMETAEARRGKGINCTLRGSLVSAPQKSPHPNKKKQRAKKSKQQQDYMKSLLKKHIS